MATVPELLKAANQHHQAGRCELAIECLCAALRQCPNHPGLFNNLGALLAQQGRLAQAAASFRQAVRFKPDLVEAHYNLGKALHRQGMLEDAITSYREALRLKPDCVEALDDLGSALLEQGKAEEAVSTLQQALRLRPENITAHNVLGMAYTHLGQFEQAIASYQQVLRRKPDYVGAYNNLGNVLGAQGKLEEAVASYQQALRLKPEYAYLHVNLGMAWLRMGNFEQGWPEYEWRVRDPKEWTQSPLPQPTWDGSPLAGRSILLRTEQGLGDTLQFIRYAPLVKAQGGTVLVERAGSLLRLLSSCPGIDRFVPEASNSTESFDLQVPLLSVPRLLGTTLATIPANIPYLFADAELVAKWRQELCSVSGFKIGIAWQCNPKLDAQRGRAAQRSVPLVEFAPVGRLTGVSLFSLQRGAGTEQLAQARGQFPIRDLGSWIDDGHGAFLATAAVMKCLDLVVTCDTALAHLAGALGVPVWVALPFSSDWRWLLDREDSPWYPTMRLFRQRQPGDWKPVFERITSEVGKLQSKAV